MLLPKMNPLRPERQPIRPEIPWQAIINAQARGLTSLKRKITA